MIAEEPLILGCLASITEAFAERDTAGLPHPAPQDYYTINTSERVVNLMLGTARLSSLWDGILKNEESVGC